ncbi:MAG: hypothetical protein HYX51_05140, partial [Chloroflexi bacterium]|nr:hypothetical protein [Chloroflexota bacterium]
MQYVALDLEMTGVDLESDEIIEIGAVKFNSTGVSDKFETLVNPGRALPRRIESLTGIRGGEVKSAPPFSAVADALVRFVGDAPIVGQNVGWDLQFLKKHGLIPEGPVYDTAELAELLLPGRPDYSLRNVARQLGIEVGIQHRAMPDAEAAMALFLKLAERAELIDPIVLDEIVRLTAESGWPLRYFFREVASRARRVTTRRDTDVDGLALDIIRRAGEVGPALTANQKLVPVEPPEAASVFAAAGEDTARFPGFEQRPEQVAMAGAVAAALSTEGRLVVEAGTGTGKALDVDTPILTSDGWKRMGDVVVGDVVFDEFGNPTNVTATWPVLSDRPCYSVRFSDGSSIVADAEHLWKTVTRANRRGRGDPRGSIRTTAQIAESVRNGTYNNHAIRVAAPLKFGEKDLPIAPYTLGIWLGAGNAICRHITTYDNEIVEAIRTEGYTVNSVPSAHNKYSIDLAGGPVTNRWVDGFMHRLRSLNLKANKHIPSCYMAASIEQRRALLAGLLDSDGTVNRCGAIEFSNTNQDLVKDVQTLVCSLGYRASLRVKTARLRGKDCGPAWTIQFTTQESVFRLRRKAATHRERLRSFSERRNVFRYIVGVESVPSRPVRCIAVDAPSHLYLAGRTLIPTHNSLAYLVPAACYALRNNARVLVTTNTIALQEQITGKDVPELYRLLEAGAPHDIRSRVGDLRVAQIKGRRNYICLQRLTAMRRTGAQSDAEARFLARLLLWLQLTETGDRSELTLRPEEEPLWNRISAQNTTCFAGPSYYVRTGACQLLRARKRAEASHLVVANHALLLSDLAAGGRALPQYDRLIVDEAHNLEDEATSQFGFQAGQGHFTEFLDGLCFRTGGRDTGLVADIHAALRLVPDGSPASHLHTLAEGLAEAVERARARIPELFGAVNAFIVNHGELGGDYDNRLLLTSAKRAQPEWEQVELAWDNARTVMLPVEGALVKLNVGLAEANGADILDYDALLSNVAAAGQNGLQLRKSVDEIIEKHDGDRIAWMTTNRATGVVSFSSAPLHVGDVLQDYLFGRKTSVVLTSATLSTGGTFAYIKDRLGLADADDLMLGSPFDYKRAALVLLPTDIPEPSQREYQKAAEQAIVELCTASKGRALVLFTSYSALRATHAAVRKPLERAGIRVLGQGIDGTA